MNTPAAAGPIVVGFVSTSEGHAALRHAGHEALLRKLSLLVVDLSKDHRDATLAAIGADLADLRAEFAAAGLAVDIAPGRSLRAQRAPPQGHAGGRCHAHRHRAPPPQPRRQVPARQFRAADPARSRLPRAPLGLAHDVKVIRPIPKDQPLTWQDVAVDELLAAYELRLEMEALFGAQTEVDRSRPSYVSGS